MRKYSLKSMMQPQRRGTQVNMFVMNESPGFRRSYLAELRRLNQKIAKATRDTILPAYRRELTVDARESDFDALRRLIAGLLSTTTDTVRNLLLLDAIKHTERFAANAKAAFGINLQGVISTEDLQDYLDRAALRNAGLIKGMTDDLVKNIQLVTTTALVNGETAGQLQKKLKKQFELSDARARLIARDQTSKLNAELNKIRQQQAGVDKYTWRTSRDERVRERHRKLNGKVYKYGETTGAEEGQEPGQPIQCRCIAQGVIEF